MTSGETTNQNKAIVRAFYDQWNTGDIDFASLIHANIVNHQPGAEPERGRERFQRAIQGVMAAVPDSTWKIRALVAESDLVACHVTWSGTYQGTVFRQIPTPHGERFSVDHMHMYRVVDGTLAEHWVVRDDLGTLLQLGAIGQEGLIEPRA